AWRRCGARTVDGCGVGGVPTPARNHHHRLLAQHVVYARPSSSGSAIRVTGIVISPPWCAR
ncbi:MAG: hypothetical protein ACR2LJ_05920, partial [Acidimicrobiales bacterium]